MGLLDDLLRIDGGCIVTGAQNGWIGDNVALDGHDHEFRGILQLVKWLSNRLKLFNDR